MDEKSWMMSNGLPQTSYAFLITFLAGAFVFQEIILENKRCVSDFAFLAGAFVFRKTHPENKLCVSDQVPSRGFCFGVHLGSMWGPCGRLDSNLSW